MMKSTNGNRKTNGMTKLLPMDTKKINRIIIKKQDQLRNAVSPPQNRKDFIIQKTEKIYQPSSVQYRQPEQQLQKEQPQKYQWQKQQQWQQIQKLQEQKLMQEQHQQQQQMKLQQQKEQKFLEQKLLQEQEQKKLQEQEQKQKKLQEQEQKKLQEQKQKKLQEQEQKKLQEQEQKKLQEQEKKKLQEQEQNKLQEQEPEPKPKPKPRPEQNQTQNTLFHQKKEGFINSKTQNHIKNWKNYKKDSEQIQNLYRDLEMDHAFIQWIFPNFFTSMFNPQSRRLTLEERNEIIANQEYTAFYLDNFRMFMRFLGIEAIINNDSNCQFNLIDIVQFKTCVLKNTHNLMRLQRVLASLSVLGQRQLALNFLKFLKIELGKLSDKNIYNREYEHFELVKEEKMENNKSTTSFFNKCNYYFQKELLQIWNVDSNILTKDFLDENAYKKQQIK